MITTLKATLSPQFGFEPQRPARKPEAQPIEPPVCGKERAYMVIMIVIMIIYDYAIMIV